MISKKDLKVYEFKQIENYFDYIVESEINGQYRQLKKLINKLSPKQKIQCFRYLSNPSFENVKNIYHLKEFLIYNE